MQKYFVSELYPHAFFTAGVLRNDIEEILHNSSYNSIDLSLIKRGTINKIIHYRSAIRLAEPLKLNDIVFFHFPLRSRINRLFHYLAQKKRCKTVAFVHDLEGLRDGENKILKKEISQLAKFDFVIAQNPVMKNLILQHIPTSTIIVLEMYDYLNIEKRPGLSTKLTNEICFAGNVLKASFISKLTLLPGLQFYIFGESSETFLGHNIKLMGKADPRKLPTLVKGSFGLVWDGSSMETGEGFGEYLKYNTPHKLALYLAAGLPVIVWNQSAMADWVIKNEVGITVSSISEIESQINALTEMDYQQFKHKILPIQDKIRKGYYLKEALATMESYLLPDQNNKKN